MRYLLTILLCVFLFQLSAQTVDSFPKGTPVQYGRNWIRQGYIMGDSGIIFKSRDTSWQPKFPGTMTFWINSGVDTTFWVYTGRRWSKINAVVPESYFSGTYFDTTTINDTLLVIIKANVFQPFNSPLTPTGTADSRGSPGEIYYDNSYLYIKVSTGWKRITLSSIP